MDAILKFTSLPSRTKAITSVAAVAAIGLFVITLSLKRYRKSKPLFVTTVCADNKNKNICLVLIHGMWHGAWFYEPLQEILAVNGFTSHAVDFQPNYNRNPRELVADLEATFEKLELDFERVVVVGHSQGGLVTQVLLQSAEKRPEIVGACLLGTFPLGLRPPISMVMHQPSMYWGPRGLGVIGFAYYFLTGRLMSKKNAGNIFLNPESTTTPFGTRHDYEERVASAPRDGWTTMTHWFPFQNVPKFPARLKVLVLGAADDIIYPPDAVMPHFLARFPNADFVVAEGQSHGFADKGWEMTMADPLLAWLDKLDA